MGAATQLAIGGSSHIFTVLFAVASLTLQLFIPYERYARYLKWLTLVLLSYVAVVFVVHVDWAGAAKHGFPHFPLTSDSFTVIVAILGTTISPYLMFWQSSQEVEEIEKKTTAKPLAKAPYQAPKEMRRIRIDTFVGMAVSNIVAVAIMISAAATLHVQGKTEIASAADAAEALGRSPVNLHLLSSAWESSEPDCFLFLCWQVRQLMPSANPRTGNVASKTSHGRLSVSIA